MKIALVTLTYPPDNGWGGIGTYVHHLAPALARLGHRISILCGYRREPSVCQQDGLRIVRRIRAAETNAARRATQIAALLEEEIATQGIELVEFGEYGGDGVIFQRRQENFPVVVKMHCPTRLCAMGEAPAWQQWLRRRYLAPAPRAVDRLERESVERASVVLSPSRWLLEAVRALGWSLPGTAAVVRNPFGGWAAVSARPEASPRQTDPSVLLLGRLARLKGVDRYLEIFLRVWRERPETYFDLVGQDTWRTRKETWRQYLLRRTVPRHRAQLRFHGGVPYPELPAVLARPAVALFASRWESSSYTLMECMGSGLPCVVGSGGGAQELGEDNVSVLQTGGDPGAMATGVLRLLADPEARRRLGEAAREQVAREFAPARIAAEMEGYYRQAAAFAAAGGGLPTKARPRTHPASSQLRTEQSA